LKAVVADLKAKIEEINISIERLHED